MPVYTAEMYPTSIRNIGVGACNVAAGLSLVSATLIFLQHRNLHSFLVWFTDFYSSFVWIGKRLKAIYKLLLINVLSIHKQNTIGGHWLMTLLTLTSLFGAIIIIFVPATIERRNRPESPTNDER